MLCFLVDLFKYLHHFPILYQINRFFVFKQFFSTFLEVYSWVILLFHVVILYTKLCQVMSGSFVIERDAVMDVVYLGL